MKFPDVNYGIYTQDTEDGRYEVKKQCTHVIRLITRLIFVWFIKQKGLIDESLFDVDFLKNSVRGFNDQTDNQNYYNAILQNLFFASLNCKKEDRGWASSGHTGYTNDYGNDVKFKDDSQNSFFINNSKTQIENILKQIPYLNGGLFDCLDYIYDPLDDPLHKFKGKIFGKRNPKVYVDGFSQEQHRRAIVPDMFFFGYTDSAHKGIIDQIFDKYYFTIEENSTNIIDVALDPELLGHVFEELLSVYNPETGVTMRKATGSFYTPKEIVEYMVTQSVAQYLASKISDVPAADFLRLIEDEEISETVDSHRKEIVEAVIRCKIFDPACGSGAFPMGCLHVLNNIVSILDDEKNTFWKEIVINQTKEAHIKQAERFEKTFNQTEFEEAEKQITENFTNNLKYPNYLRKLYILEHCIYGSDIQRIAMQITKLRFFISLVVEQRDNDNIQTLPNLETKFTCANTLIDNPDPTKNANNFDDAFNKEFKQLISNLANQLKDHRSKIFNTPDRKKKIELKKQDSILRNSIADETKKIIDNYRNYEIANCKQKIADAEKTIDDFLAQPDDTKIEVSVSYNIFGEKEEKKTKTSQRKQKIEKYSRIKADWERKLQLFANGGQFQPYQTYAERLCEWNPYDMSADNCSFFDAEWMFGIKDGFDVVIGNPPYGAKLTNKEKAKYRMIFPETQFKIDTYSLFILQSFKVFANKGLCFYIIPNTFLDNYFEEAVRDKVLGGSIIEINDLTDKVFDGAVVHSMIFGFSNKKNPSNVVKVNDSPILSSDFKNIPQIFFLEQPQHSFSIRQYETSELMDKLKGNSKRLVEVLDIRQAIKSGNDSKYITTDKLANNYKPILRGKDIKKFTIIDPNLYIDYGKHLACPRHPQIFEQPKILIREAGAKIVATLDEANYYIMSSLYNAILIDKSFSLKYLLGLIDSKLFQYLMDKLTFEKTKGAFTKAKIFHYYELPIRIATAAQQKPIIALVDEILTKKKQNSSEDTTDLEGKIDKLVYELYGLTDEEIKVVETCHGTSK